MACLGCPYWSNPAALTCALIPLPAAARPVGGHTSARKNNRQSHSTRLDHERNKFVVMMNLSDQAFSMPCHQKPLAGC
jgi:hypothetical protein